MEGQTKMGLYKFRFDNLGEILWSVPQSHIKRGAVGDKPRGRLGRIFAVESR